MYQTVKRFPPVVWQTGDKHEFFVYKLLHIITWHVNSPHVYIDYYVLLNTILVFLNFLKKIRIKIQLTSLICLKFREKSFHVETKWASNNKSKVLMKFYSHGLVKNRKKYSKIEPFLLYVFFLTYSLFFVVLVWDIIFIYFIRKNL